MSRSGPVICHRGTDMHPFQDQDVAKTFERWPQELRSRILVLREMIFEVAAHTRGVGEIVETLKWNVPAYLTVKPKSGTTLRLEGNGQRGIYGLYVPCSTSLIEQCKEIYQKKFTYNKNRGLIFELNSTIPENELRHFIAMALTYHVKSGPNATTFSRKQNSHEGL